MSECVKMGSTRLEIKLGPCYFESRNRCTAGMPPGGRGRGAAAGGGARAPPAWGFRRAEGTNEKEKPEGVQQYIYTRVISQACFRIGPPLSSLLRVPSGASSGVTPRRGDGRPPVIGCVVASVT